MSVGYPKKGIEHRYDRNTEAAYRQFIHKL